MSEGEMSEGAPADFANAARTKASHSKPAPKPAAPEKLFPFVLRAKKFIVGRDTLLRCRSRLQFILITTDISENSREEILKNFASYPIIQKYTPTELERFLGLHNTRVVGFEKSSLASSLYAALKESRINKPEQKPA
jgi:hypothetical protein